MGKKSTGSLPEPRETNSDYLTPSETARVTELGQHQGLLEALMQHKNQRQTMPKAADGLLWLHSGWRAEDRDKYLREVSLCILSFDLIGVQFWNKMLYSSMCFCIVDARRPPPGFETARQWLHLNARPIPFFIDGSCNHKYTLYFFFLLKQYTGNPDRGFIYQSFLICISCNSWITDWHVISWECWINSTLC